MADSLLPAPTLLNSNECGCKWVHRPMGWSVIRIDIPHDMVSVDCNIKSTRGHTSIHMTLWDSRAQYKGWNAEEHPPRDRTCHQIEAFRAAKRKARSIMQSQCISLQHTAHACWMCSARCSALFEHPTPYRAYYSKEDALVYWDI